MSETAPAPPIEEPVLYTIRWHRWDGRWYVALVEWPDGREGRLFWPIQPADIAAAVQARLVELGMV